MVDGFWLIFVFMLARTKEKTVFNPIQGQQVWFVNYKQEVGVIEVVDFGHFGCKIWVLLFTNLTKNP